MTKWQARFIRFAKEVSTWSKDPKAQVGCVIVSPDKRQITYGYNGFPPTVPDYEESLVNEELKLKLMVHAELNAILNARTSLANWHLYSTKCLCLDCAKAVIQSGITSVTCPPINVNSKWHETNEEALALLSQADIAITTYNEDLL